MTSPQANHPPRTTLAQRAARHMLAALGWRVDVTPPPTPKCVILVYPHTSNWDFFYGYLARLAMELPLQWIGKSELFRGPFATVFRSMGGIPVDRSERTGMIAQLKAEFDRRPFLWLAIAPEGTRAHTARWKSGFYHLAVSAGIPVGLAFIDYRTRVVGLSTFLTMTGDVEADLRQIRDVYSGITGRHPERAGEIRFDR